MAFKKDLSTLVLGILQDEGLHGYEIAKRIREKGVNALEVAEGRLYPVLHKLESEQMIHAEWIPQEGRPSRKVYSLTEAGRGELSRQRKAWHSFAESVDSILGSDRPSNPKLGAPQTKGGAA